MSKTYTLTATALTRYTGTGRVILSDGASCSKVTAAAANYVGYQSAYKAVRAEFDHDVIDHLRTLTSSQITSITIKIPITASRKSTVQSYYGTCKAVADTKCYVDKQYNLNLTGGADTTFTLDATSAGIPKNSYAWAFGGTRAGQSSDYCKTIGNPTVIVVTTETDYTLSYDANGGSGAPSSQSAAGVGSAKFTISSTSPTRSGYVFKGWATSSTATSASYQPGGTITISANTTLYAVWYKTYTLSYNANGGSGAPSSQSGQGYSSATITISATEPTRSGYTFKGWATSSTATSASYQPGGSITISANTTLYAVWYVTIKLTYNANGGSGAPSTQSQTVYSSATFTVSATQPTKPGFVFAGWADSSTATTAAYQAGDSITTSANKTIYAVWVSSGCPIHYYDGSAIKDCELYYFDGSNLKQCELYYFDGNSLIKTS